MKIKSAEHCDEMREMLSGIPLWIYGAGILVWGVMVVLFLVCLKNLEYEKVEKIPLVVSIAEDSSFVAVAQVPLSYREYFKENQDAEFLIFPCDSVDACLTHAVIRHVTVYENEYQSEYIKIVFVFDIGSPILKQHIDLSKRHWMVLHLWQTSLWQQIRKGFGKFY